MKMNQEQRVHVPAFVNSKSIPERLSISNSFHVLYYGCHSSLCFQCDCNVLHKLLAVFFFYWLPTQLND